MGNKRPFGRSNSLEQAIGNAEITYLYSPAYVSHSVYLTWFIDRSAETYFRIAFIASSTDSYVRFYYYKNGDKVFERAIT